MFRLPQRYREDFEKPFRERLEPHLVSGCRILDVGSGRRPLIPPGSRPEGCHYVGLDIDARELQIAPEGAYAEAWTVDITGALPEALHQQFDVVISFQAIEHVSSVPRALANMRAALKPGGFLLFQTSGAWGVLPALVNRVLPQRVSLWLLARMTGRDPGTVFPAVYDRCWYSAFRTDLRDWTDVEVIPCYWGGSYLLRVPPLFWAYLAWEEFTRRCGLRNLATHYLVAAYRPGTGEFPEDMVVRGTRVS